MASPLRFAPLIRVSTERQEDRGESLRVQRTTIESDVQRLGGAVATWAYCGQEHATPDQERRKLAALLRDAATGTFNAVIVADPTRWARDNLKSKKGLEVFRAHGIRFFVGSREYDLHAPSDRLFLGMSVEFAEFHALEQARKSLLSRIAKAERIGAPMGGRPSHLPFGRVWRWDDPHKQSGHWEIDPEAKASVQLAVDRYLRGEGIESLAQALGITYSGGRHGYQKLYRILRHHLGGTWVQRFHSPRLNIQAEVSTEIPPLIDDPATIEAVHTKLDRGRTFHTARKRRYLLSRRVRCALCGGTFSGQAPHRRYYAHLDHRRSTCPAAKDHPRVPADELERAVLAELFHLFREAPARERAVKHAAPPPERNDQLREQVATVHRQLDSINRERANLIQGMKELGAAAVTDDFRAELARMATQERSLEDQRAQLERELAQVPDRKDLTARARAVAEALERVRGELLRDCDHFDEMTWDEQVRLVEWAMPHKPRAFSGTRPGVHVKWDGAHWRYRLECEIPTPWPIPGTQPGGALPIDEDEIDFLIGRNAQRHVSTPESVGVTVPLAVPGQLPENPYRPTVRA